METFSVIIPTLQRSTVTSTLIDMYCAHPEVAEVIIINNAQKQFPAANKKIRVFDQTQNIFVNAAWNLGVKEAQTGNIIISNDDILFSPHVIDKAAKALRLPIGVLGPSGKAFKRPSEGRVSVSPAYRWTGGFGTLMFMRRDNYVPIPSDLRVWCGDLWLFSRQRKRNAYLNGPKITTIMSTTSGSPEFDVIKRADGDLYTERYLDSGYADRYRVEATLSRGIGKLSCGMARVFRR